MVDYWQSLSLCGLHTESSIYLLARRTASKVTVVLLPLLVMTVGRLLTRPLALWRLGALLPAARHQVPRLRARARHLLAVRARVADALVAPETR